MYSVSLRNCSKSCKILYSVSHVTYCIMSLIRHSIVSHNILPSVSHNILHSVSNVRYCIVEVVYCSESCKILYSACHIRHCIA